MPRIEAGIKARASEPGIICQPRHPCNPEKRLQVAQTKAFASSRIVDMMSAKTTIHFGATRVLPERDREAARADLGAVERRCLGDDSEVARVSLIVHALIYFILPGTFLYVE